MKQGDVIAGYVFDKPLGQGGMAEVWRAHREGDFEALAIKVLLPDLCSIPEIRRRFEREGQIHLTHPNVVPVLDLAEIEGRPAIVMPYCSGGPLENRIRRTPEERARNSGSPLPLKEVFGISRQILDALNFANTKFIIHRDVKPANILFDDEGKACLSDFGIALDMRRRDVTRAGGSLGTPCYMSPEQILKPDKVLHLADVYSFGCVLYDMLTGRPPFDSDDTNDESWSFKVRMMQVQDEPRPIRELNADVPPRLQDLTMRALAKKPEERIAGCGEFARELEEIEREAEEDVIIVPPLPLPLPLPEPPPPPPPPFWRRKAVLALAAVAFFFVLWQAGAAGFRAYSGWADRQQEQERELARLRRLREEQLLERERRVEEARKRRAAEQAAEEKRRAEQEKRAEADRQAGYEADRLAEEERARKAREQAAEEARKRLALQMELQAREKRRLELEAALEAARRKQADDERKRLLAQQAEEERRKRLELQAEDEKRKRLEAERLAELKRRRAEEEEGRRRPTLYPQRPTDPRRPYTGASSGTLVWEGEVNGTELVEIRNGRASSGRVVGGQLPGVACLIQPADPRRVSVAAAPSPLTGWDRLVFRVTGRGQMIVRLNWALP